MLGPGRSPGCPFTCHTGTGSLIDIALVGHLVPPPRLFLVSSVRWMGSLYRISIFGICLGGARCGSAASQRCCAEPRAARATGRARPPGAFADRRAPKGRRDLTQPTGHGLHQIPGLRTSCTWDAPRASGEVPGRGGSLSREMERAGRGRRSPPALRVEDGRRWCWWRSGLNRPGEEVGMGSHLGRELSPALIADGAIDVRRARTRSGIAGGDRHGAPTVSLSPHPPSRWPGP
jgi:hypothetical protein